MFAELINVHQMVADVLRRHGELPDSDGVCECGFWSKSESHADHVANVLIVHLEVRGYYILDLVPAFLSRDGGGLLGRCECDCVSQCCKPSDPPVGHSDPTGGISSACDLPAELERAFWAAAQAVDDDESIHGMDKPYFDQEMDMVDASGCGMPAKFWQHMADYFAKPWRHMADYFAQLDA